jgi:hypothetical protein
MRSPRTITRLLAMSTVVAVMVVLSSAALALAKKGGLVALAAPIPRDAEPGSSLTVTFSVTVPGESGATALTGSPVVLTLVGPDGTKTEALGSERGTPGTYVAVIKVPASGIQSAYFGLRGTMTKPDGTTATEDLGFDVDGLLFTTVAHPAAAPLSDSGTTTAPPPADYRLAIVGLLAALAGAIAVGAVVVAGRRGSLRSTKPKDYA